MVLGKIGELLVRQKLISPAQLTAATEHTVKNKKRLSSSLVELGHVNENVLVAFLSRQYGMEAVSLSDREISSDITQLVPANICDRHGLVPLELDKQCLTVAISDPTNVSAVDDLRFLTNLEIKTVLGAESQIRSLITRFYQLGSSDAVQKAASSTEDAGGGAQISVGVAQEAHEVDDSAGSGDKPVIALMNKILLEAVQRKASDIHIEPFDSFSRVRFRIDGVLHEIMKLPPQLKTATPARIKIMASLDISEKRLPQDGRIQVRTQNRKIDIRVSILPTIFGEKVVMRILDQGSSTPDLVKIGFEEEQLKVFRKGASQPYGMVLVTGPTGSGKSTTLYAALNELNGPDVNISTVEDPVEYNMLGANQVNVKESIGMTFASALRSLLRQDPDLIMVGEIRDQETAEIAIKSALTGHMVFSTLHTNDAPSTITRLVHMGIEPFLITASLTIVQAQRLIRVNCEFCKAPDINCTAEMATAAEMPSHWLATFQPMRGTGCDKCGKTGYKGRRGIFEVMSMNEKLRSLVVKSANSDLLKKAAIENGMLTLRQHALLKLYRGETTLEEVLNNSRSDGDMIL